MFDVGFSELMLLFVIGLLVLGPQRLPKVAAEIGKWVGRARRTANELRRQLEREIELSEVIQPPPRPSEPLPSTEGNSAALSASAEPGAAVDAPEHAPAAGDATPAVPSEPTTAASPAEKPEAAAAGRTPPPG